MSSTRPATPRSIATWRSRCSPDAAADPDRKRRFALEAKAASALNHPGIVTVHDMRTDGDTDFIVMEYVDGRTLDDVIPDRRACAVDDALRYGCHGRRAGDGPCGGHRPSRSEAGQRHGDARRPRQGPRLRPGQADRTGAPATDARPEAADRGGTVLGTVAYMSPEQARGRSGRRPRDIFSFGAVLYQMVTGRTPFAADSRVATLAKILDEDPVPPSRIVAVAAGDRAGILRCLRKDPARRYQTMADLKVALETSSPTPTPAHWPRRGRAGRRPPARGCGPRLGAARPCGRRRCRRLAHRSDAATGAGADGRAARLAARCRPARHRSRPTATRLRSRGTARTAPTRTSMCSRLAPARPSG